MIVSITTCNEPISFVTYLGGIAMKRKGVSVLLSAAIFWLFGVFVLLGLPQSAHAATIGSKYEYLEIGDDVIDLTKSFGLKGNDSDGGSYLINENYIEFTNYKGNGIMVRGKSSTEELLLIFRGRCQIAANNIGIGISDWPNVRIVVETTKDVPEALLDISAKLLGIYVNNPYNPTHVRIQGDGSSVSKLHVNVPYQYSTSGIKLSGAIVGPDRNSYLEISKILVDSQAYYALQGQGRHYKDSSYKEGIALGTDGALVCSDAKNSTDHSPWFLPSAAGIKYVSSGSSDGTHFSLTPVINKVNFAVDDMKKGRVPYGSAFPQIFRNANGRYDFYRNISLKKNGTTVSPTSKLSPDTEYTVEFGIAADDGFQFNQAMTKADVQLPDGFTLQSVKVMSGEFERPVFRSYNYLVITATVKSEALVIDTINLTTNVKHISAGAAPETPEVKIEGTPQAKVVNAKWSDSKYGVPFTGKFEDGKTYYIYTHIDGVGAYFSESPSVWVNEQKIGSDSVSIISDGRSMYVTIPYTAHVLPLVKVSQEADCEAEGYKLHYECSGCGKWFDSAEGDKEITDKSAYTLPPTGHDWGDWEMDPHDGDLHYRYCKHNPSHDEAAPHQFVKAEDTAKRTTTYTCSVCGYEKTYTWEEEPAPEVPDDTPIPPDDAPPAGKEDTIITEDIKDKELDIARFHLLQLRYKSITNNSITLVWNKVDGAKAYYVYGSLCGQDYKKLKKIKAGSKLQYTQKKLKKGKYYKYLVTAVTSYKKKAVVIAASKTVHLATTGGKVGNYKSVKLTNVTGGKLTIKKGKTFKIQATAVPASKKLTVKQHRKLCYESSDQEIATVTAKGTIKAMKKGTCVIYVYAQSGKFGKIKVTVK